MATRREIVEAILFLPAMALLAALLFAAFAAVIFAGEWLLSFWMWLFAGVLPLPRSMAMALSVLATVAVVTAAGTWLFNGSRRRKPRPN